MSRVFWDSMLFIHFVEGPTADASTVMKVLERCFLRGDKLFTSHLSIAEALVGLPAGSGREARFLEMLEDCDFQRVDFGAEAANHFRHLRASFGLKQPDSMNLGCAAATGTDIYLTGDRQLLGKRLHVPGIHFIADFKNAPL